MNYITACPECGTQFLLTTEHLKAHRGKVQCGHCEHVFNAKNRVTEISDDITSAAEYQASLESQQADQATIEESLQVANEEIPPTYIGESSTAVFNPASEKESSGLANPISIDDLTTDPKFTQKKFKINIWYALLGLLLLLAAALQYAYFMRTQIAAEYPQFKPLLQQGCQYLQCQIELPKDLDLLLIDDSDMQENDSYEGVINFSSSLINKAHYAQTYPNIELTLTNADDQPVLRRMITPQEYLAPNTKVDAGLAAHEEVRIKLALHASDLAVAGYRVLLVY